MVAEIGSGNLSKKTYKGTIPGWGNLTGPEVIEHMINKAGEAEGGFDPNYKPPSKGSDTASLYGVPVASPGSKKGNKYFDPSAESSSTAGKLATKLSADCKFNVDQMKVSCEAHRTSMQSTLRWYENATNTELLGEEEGIFEFDLANGSDSKVTVLLEECIATTCKEVGTDVSMSNSQ